MAIAFDCEVKPRSKQTWNMGRGKYVIYKLTGAKIIIVEYKKFVQILLVLTKALVWRFLVSCNGRGIVTKFALI